MGLVTIETEFLIAGAGPAGSSLACFLASYGFKGLVIAKAPGTANTPRAHITSAATLECFRDLGIEDEVLRASVGGEALEHVRWCASIAGEEYARTYAFGRGPETIGDYKTISPCAHVDIPQTLLEPILVRFATINGFKVRFDTTLVSFQEVQDIAGPKVIANVMDRLTGFEYRIKTKYLFGADGAHSVVVSQLGLPMSVGAGGEHTMINVLVKTDLSHLMEYRKGNLHWVVQPDRDDSDGLGTMCCARMIKPWSEWMFILVASPTLDLTQKILHERYLERIRSVIGDDSPAEILHVGSWKINETYAESFSKGNIFGLGDAVHRHPPARGLGSNTCIQDAYNLAWKVAYVERGLASPSILDTYSIERQPVGRGIVENANSALRANALAWEVFGTFPEPRPEALIELTKNNGAGATRRHRLQEAVKFVSSEYNGIGLEMGQHYKSRAVYLADEDGPRKLSERELADPVLYLEPNTYPGSRLPHAWLNKAIPAQPVSTLDLAGHGVFTLFTGNGGIAWQTAAASVSKATGVTVKAISIGYRQDWEDVYFSWAKARGVEESGAVLVRPDRVVVWRANAAPAGGVQESEDKLMTVVKYVLGF